MPIGDGEAVRCPGCGTSVEIPEAYRRLRDAAQQGDDARARAEAMSHELARPPSWPLRFWMFAGNVAMLLAALLVIVWLLVSLVLCIGHFIEAGIIGAVIMLFIGLVLGVSVMYDQGLHALAGPLQIDVVDVWGGAVAHGLFGLAVFVATVVPIVLAGYAESFESVRTALRNALSAAPPVAPGGAAQCRNCGGPLDELGARAHVRCVYCGADNLAHLPAAQLATIESQTKIVCDDLESAMAQETSAAREGRSTVVARLLGWLVLVPIAVLLGWAVAALNETDVTYWEAADDDAPMLPDNADNPVLPREQATLFAVHDTFDRCDDRECFAYYYVPLGAGETPVFAAEGGDLELRAISERFLGPWYNPTYEWRPLELTNGAPYSGWYRVQLTTALEQGPEPQVRWTATR